MGGVENVDVDKEKHPFSIRNFHFFIALSKLFKKRKLYINIVVDYK